MIDERLIIDLLNQRFDDMSDRIDDLKRDVLSTADKHSKDDEVRFEKLESDVSKLNQMKWTILGMVSGLSSGGVVAIQKVLEHFKS